MKCPKCGSEHYKYEGSISTLLGTYAEYKDGEIIQRNPNITTDQVTCLECDERFEITHQNENEMRIGYLKQSILKCDPINNPMKTTDNKEVLDAFDRLKTFCQSENGYPYNQYLKSSIKRDEDLEIIERFIKENS